jgi:hypothetical protein
MGHIFTPSIQNFYRSSVISNSCFCITFERCERIVIGFKKSLTRKVIDDGIFENDVWIFGCDIDISLDWTFDNLIISVDSTDLFRDIFFDRDIFCRSPRRNSGRESITSESYFKSKFRENSSDISSWNRSSEFMLDKGNIRRDSDIVDS